jgi:cytochrome c
MKTEIQTQRLTMKRVIATGAATLGLLLAGSVQADEKLAQANGCLACHSIEKKILGPAYKDVAAKYKDDKAAEASLVKKVKAGGTGVWGTFAMPPNTQVKDADIAALVKWILAQK